MALRVYRFRVQGPGADLDQIEKEVDSPLVLSTGASGGSFVDITLEETASGDLIEALAFRGYTFVEQDPATAVGSAFFASVSDGHEALNTLVHKPAGNRFVQLVYGGPGNIRLDQSITWTDNTLTKKVEECVLSYTGAQLTAVVVRRFDPTGPGVGTVVAEEVKMFGYAGGAASLRLTAVSVTKTV